MLVPKGVIIDVGNRLIRCSFFSIRSLSTSEFVKIILAKSIRSFFLIRFKRNKSIWTFFCSSICYKNTEYEFGKVDTPGMDLI